jgi:hypothetical protein
MLTGVAGSADATQGPPTRQISTCWTRISCWMTTAGKG